MRYIFLFVLLLALPVARYPSKAQSLEGGARLVALGGAGTALSGEAWGHANPASWAALNQFILSSFASQAFGLSELRLVAAQAVVPFRWGRAALSGRSFGFEDYRETHWGLGYAQAFRLGTTRALRMGLHLRYYRTTIAQYGSAGALGLSVGGQVNIHPLVGLGFHATNVNLPKLAGREPLPRTFAVGLAYQADPRFLLLFDVFKDLDFSTSLRGGLEIQPVPALALRAGYTTQPTRFTAGIGLHVGPISGDIAAERHAQLGWSPAVSFSAGW